MLELSCADYTFPLLARQQVLALLRLLAFDFVDIGLFARNPNFNPSDLAAAPRQFTAGVQSDLKGACLRPSDVFLQTGESPNELSSNDPDRKVRQAARDAFSRAVEFCRAIQCAHLTGLPGVLHDDFARDFALAAEEATWRVETARQAEVTYAVEPHVGSICAATHSAHQLLSQVPGLTLTLDYGHFIFQGEPNAAINKLLPHASHLHLRGACPGRLQTPVSESSIDLRHIVQTLRAGYSGKLALEYVWTDWCECNYTDNLSETILLRRQVTELEANLNAGNPEYV